MDRYPLQHDRNILHPSKYVNYIWHYENHVCHCVHGVQLYSKLHEALSLLIKHQKGLAPITRSQP